MLEMHTFEFCFIVRSRRIVCCIINVGFFYPNLLMR